VADFQLTLSVTILISMVLTGYLEGHKLRFLFFQRPKAITVNESQRQFGSDMESIPWFQFHSHSGEQTKQADIKPVSHPLPLLRKVHGGTITKPYTQPSKV
jgi:hypothetical protein